MFKMIFFGGGVGGGYRGAVKRCFNYDFEVWPASLQSVQKNVNKTIFSISLFLVKFPIFLSNFPFSCQFRFW